ncbi:hypothetical protein LG634_27265 [Streptomyces bambusae]|uniref:hypothetical protein n=1 Tax=Streptomyces bambusae TaxID=1550616 RepID=UPI001CFD9294|nr:hypothetical protein [Streptomyces bambusae]MCB5168510.1 hypothetical protein [Streptomyces bambusae]
MANGGLWVGVLTALTALGASYLTARATSRAALAQARTTTRAEALREQRDRRRSTYREMMDRAHAFNEVTWQIDEVDAASDEGTRSRCGPTGRDRGADTRDPVARGVRGPDIQRPKNRGKGTPPIPSFLPQPDHRSHG